MERLIKENGSLIMQKDLEYLYTTMGNTMKDHGKIIRRVEKENTFIQMGLHMRVNGKMTHSMDRGLKTGAMVPLL